MLSRTAEGLFWTARYMERAETVSRLLEVGYRMSMIPSMSGGYDNEWESILSALGANWLFSQHYDEANQRNVESFLIYDERNPSSIKNCLAYARQNARATRTALTSDVWDSLNRAYLEFQDFERIARSELNLPELCDWTKRKASALRGAFENSQLQEDGYDFFNLGLYIERADNTARLLDVKYYVLLPDAQGVGGGVDAYQWSTLLRAMSVRRAFHWAYGGETTAAKIADFLIFNVTCPRSLLHCVEKMDYHLTRLSRAYKMRSEAHSAVNSVMAELVHTTAEEVIDSGMHEFLTDFIAKKQNITAKVSTSYLFGDL